VARGGCGVKLSDRALQHVQHFFENPLLEPIKKRLYQ
jgi:hypothetical protein